ncbi:Conserved_hypothetical protein [Hexamita inflata]|uniref:Protein kinase domain-containing protein n=1 Tax=Hexamita inflata TaxID=28002 RepID=A0AA86NZ98_9EUKA|nr:Conserved hypothetical protein [Hexamita inflata]
MPILHKIAQSPYSIMVKRFLKNASSEETYAQIFKQLNMTDLAEFNKGTYGVIYISGDVLYKCVRYPEKASKDVIKQKIFNNRLFFQQEQEIHEYVYNASPELTCSIFAPIIFGPLMIIKIGLLNNYETLFDFRKRERTPAYTILADKIALRMHQISLVFKQLNVFHGDHKANNVMFRENPFDVRVIDFGKARFYSEINGICSECNKKYLKTGFMMSRKLCVFQNYYYSSVLQYVFNEYQHQKYYELMSEIDNHSIGLLLTHLYFKDYVNDFSKASSADGRRQQFYANVLKLFGAQYLADLIQIANETAGGYLGDDSSRSDENEEEFEEWGFVKQNNLVVSDEMKNAIKIHDNYLYVSKKVMAEINEVWGEEKNFEHYLKQIENKEVVEKIKELMDVSGIKKLMQ